MKIQHTVNGRVFVIDAQMLDYLVIAAEALANIVSAQASAEPAPEPAPEAPKKHCRPRNVPTGFLSLDEVLALVPFKGAELYRRGKVGKFPRPVRRGVWSRVDVEAWKAGTWKPTT